MHRSSGERNPSTPDRSVNLAGAMLFFATSGTAGANVGKLGDALRSVHALASNRWSASGRELKWKRRRLASVTSPLLGRGANDGQTKLRGRVRHQKTEHDRFDAEALETREKVQCHRRALFRPGASLPAASRIEQVERALNVRFDLVRLV